MQTGTSAWLHNVSKFYITDRGIDLKLSDAEYTYTASAENDIGVSVSNISNTNFSAVHDNNDKIYFTSKLLRYIIKN